MIEETEYLVNTYVLGHLISSKVTDEVDKSGLRNLKALFRPKLKTRVVSEMATTQSTPIFVHKTKWGERKQRVVNKSCF